MYSDKRAKVSSSEIPAYSNLIPETCSVDSPEIPVPGYFRLSQTYATSKNPDYDSEAMSPNTTLMQLNRVTPKAQSTPFVDVEKKLTHDQETRSSSPAQSPEPKVSTLEEKTCSTEASISSPELPHREGKGGYNKRINRVLV